MASVEQYAQWLVNNQDKKGTPDFETVANAYRSLRSPVQTPEPAVVTKPAGFSLSDIATAFGQGAVGSTEAITNVAGAGNVLSQGLGSLSESLQKQYSPERQAEMQRQQERMQQAEKTGSTWEEVKAGLQNIYEAPLQSIAQGIGSFVPYVPAMFAGPVAATLGLSARAVAAANLAAKAYAPVVGTAQGAGSVKGAIYEAVYKAEKESGLSDDEASQKADAAQSYAGKNLDQIALGAGLGYVASKGGVEKFLTKEGREKAGEKAFLPRVGSAVAEETLTEGAQGGQERLASNVALQRTGRDVPTWQGVAGQAAQEGIIGGLTAGPVSAISGGKSKAEIEQDRLKAERDAFEERRKAFVEQQEKTKQNLQVPDMLALPAPAKKVEPTKEESVLSNPVGNIGRNELNPEVTQYIDQYRQANNLPQLDSYSIEDIKDAMTQVNPEGEKAALDSILTAKTGFSGEVKYTPEDVINAAVEKNIAHETNGFQDFLQRTTGERDLKAMSEPQLYSAFKALSDMKRDNTDEQIVLPEGSNASRFTQEQYQKGQSFVASQLASGDPVAASPLREGLKDVTGLKTDRDVHTLLQSLIKNEDLNVKKTDQDYEITSATPTKDVRAPLPKGYSIEEGTYAEGERPAGFEITPEGRGKPLTTVDLEEEVAPKIERLTGLRQQQAAKMLADVNKYSASVKAGQTNLDGMEARGLSGTEAFAKSKAQQARRVDILNKRIQSLLNRIEEMSAPLKSKPVGKKPITAKKHTLYKDGKSLGTFPSRLDAESSMLSQLSDAELDQLSSDTRFGGITDRAVKEKERRKSPEGIAVKGTEEGLAQAGVYTKSSPEMIELEKKLVAALSKFGLKDVALKVVRAIENNAEGSYEAKLIRIVLDAANPFKTMRHEVIHALKELGFFTKEQVRVLEKKAKDEWVDRYLAKKAAVYEGKTMSRLDAYRKMGLSESELLEEAIADAFADFDANKAPPGMIAALLNKLRNFFKAMRQALTGAGFESAEDIFGKIEAGKLDKQMDKADKAGESIEKKQEKYALRSDRSKGQFTPDENTISTRKPTSVGPAENYLTEKLNVGIGVVKEDPVLMRKHAELIKNDPMMGTFTSDSDEETINHFIEALKDNLIHLWNSTPKNIRERSRNWYKGANRIANNLAKGAGISERAASGVLAALSPQTPWDTNVSQAARVITIWKNHQNTVADDAMRDWFDDKIAILDNKNVSSEAMVALRDAIDGTSFGQTHPDIQAWWLRAYDETHHSREYHLVAPEGESAGLMLTDKGKPAMMPWGNTDNIDKALSILNDDSISNISEQMGNAHKVRSFYNNIADPDSKDEHVTIDTHAVAAARMEPLSGSAPEVLQAWGGKGSSTLHGQGGLYGEYAEAYRRAAQELDVLPREVQSVTWEKIRGFFPDTFKTERTKNHVKSIWEQYQQGNITAAQARQQITEYSPNENPNWHGVRRQSAEDAQSTPNEIEPTSGAVGGRQASTRGRGTASFSLREAPNTPEFKRWFGNSKIVDESGRPVPVYHATRAPKTGELFSQFRLSDDGKLGEGIYASSIPEYAEGYSISGPLMPLWASIENPFVISIDSKFIEYETAPFGETEIPDGRKYPYISSKKPIEEQIEQFVWEQTRGKQRAADLMGGRLRNLFEKAGHDGVVIKDEDGNFLEVNAFRPEQVKSATGNIGTYDPTNPDIRYSLRDPLGMYSELENKIKQLGPNTAPASNWKTMINAMTQKGVKPDEIEWSGVRDFLDLQTGKVSKDQVLEYLKNGGVKVEETVLDASAPTKYGQYTLPGGENYREVLLTLPVKVSTAGWKTEQYRPDAWTVFDADGKKVGSFPADNEQDAIDQARRYRSQAPEQRVGRDYKSSHWNQPNVLAHIRLNDRTDADGNKVLFVEELQSDWGQEGKKRGFSSPQDQSQLDALSKQFNTLGAERRAAEKEMADLPDYNERFAELQDRVAQIEKERDAISNQADELRTRVRNPIPAAPFVTKTEGWLNLALKRVMVMAAEGGYDKVAFVNGEQSADRYDLSKQVDSIAATRTKDGSYTLLIERSDGGDPINRRGVTNADLENLVGKELAQKIVDDTSGDKKNTYLSGLDLKVGGEGMKAFYDKIVPIAVNKLLPKVGGGKMSDVTIGGNDKLRSVRDDDGTYAIEEKRFDEYDQPYWEPIAFGMTEKRAAEVMGEDKRSQQPGFSVTPEMKRTVETTGLPRFSLRDVKSEIESMPNGSQIFSAIKRTTHAREEKGFIDRITDALSPQSFSRFRAQALDRYNQLSVREKELAQDMGGIERLADSNAHSAALMSDLHAGVTAQVLGVDDGIGGVPVYDKGFTTVSNLNGTVKGPMDIFKSLAAYGDPTIYQAYQFWAAAKRGKRLLAEGKEENIELPDLNFAKALEQKYPEFVNIQKEWVKFNDGLVKYMVDTGVVSAEMGKEWTKYADYIPFYRQIDGEKTLGPQIFQSISGVKAPKKLEGSQAPLADFLETVVRNTHAAVQAGMKNVAAQRAGNLAVQLQIGEKLDHVASGPDIITALENGKKVFYRVGDALFVDAVKSLNIPELPFLSFISAPADLLRNLVTKDPGFMLANLMRDSVSAYVTSGANIKPVVDTIQNFTKSVMNTSPEFEILKKAGVIGGYDYSRGIQASTKSFAKSLRKRSGTLTKTEQRLKPVTGIWDFLEKGTEASDAATRIAVYKDALKRTGNEAEALKEALEVMNFNRKGSSALVRIVTAGIPFLNARMQGLDILFRAGIRPVFKGSNPTEREKAIQRAFFVRGAMIMGISLMYAMAVKDDPDYEKQEEETKDNNWIIPKLGIRIPTPFEVGFLFKTLPERIYRLAFSGSDTAEEFSASMKRGLVSTFAFNPVPQAVLPIAEAITNYSAFTMRPIVGQNLQSIDPRYQVGPSTSVMAEKLGEQLGVSPMKIDHIYKGYTGTMGMYLVDVMDTVLDLFSDNPRPAKRFEQTPVLKRFLVDPEARGNVTAYYAFKHSVDEAVRTVNFLNKRIDEDAVGYQEEKLGLLMFKSYISSLDKQMTKLQDQATMIRSSGMPATEKRDALLEITQLQNDLVQDIRQIKKMSKEQ